MLSTIELLELAKHRQGDVTDYRISKLLGTTTQNVSNYRRGVSKPANPVAMRLGELAGVDPVEAVISVNLERSTTPEDREVWEAMLQRLEHTKRGRKAS